MVALTKEKQNLGVLKLKFKDTSYVRNTEYFCMRVMVVRADSVVSSSQGFEPLISMISAPFKVYSKKNHNKSATHSIFPPVSSIAQNTILSQRPQSSCSNNDSSGTSPGSPGSTNSDLTFSSQQQPSSFFAPAKVSKRSKKRKSDYFLSISPVDDDDDDEEDDDDDDDDDGDSEL